MKRTFKKTAVGVMAAAMVITIGATSAFAAGSGYGRNCDGTGSGYRYVDADNDGVCDNRGMGGSSENGRGRNFADADGDGVCDNNGTGRGMRQGRGTRGGCNR